MAGVDFWGNFRQGQAAREAQDAAPIRRRGLEAEVGGREFELQQARDAAGREAEFYRGLDQIRSGDGSGARSSASIVSEGDPSAAQAAAYGIEAPSVGRMPPAIAARGDGGAARVDLNAIASDPGMRDFLRNPQVLDQIAQLAIRTRRPDMLKWLNARYTAEKEGTYDAAEALSRGDVRTALETFNSRGSIKAADAKPAKDGDFGLWDVTLQDGRSIKFDVNQERAMFVDPKGYMDHLARMRAEQAKQDSPETRARIGQIEAATGAARAQAGYLGAHTDEAKARAKRFEAEAGAIERGERYRAQVPGMEQARIAAQRNQQVQRDIGGINRQIDTWAKEQKGEGSEVTPDRVFGMKTIAGEMVRAGFTPEDALAAAQDAPIPSRQAAARQALEDYRRIVKGNWISSDVEIDGKKMPKDEYVKARAEQNFRAQQQAFREWRAEAIDAARGGAGGEAGDAPAPAQAPAAAIDFLKSAPALAPKFDEKYGRGAAARVLGGGVAPASRPAPAVEAGANDRLRQIEAERARERGPVAPSTLQAPGAAPPSGADDEYADIVRRLPEMRRNPPPRFEQEARAQWERQIAAMEARKRAIESTYRDMDRASAGGIAP